MTLKELLEQMPKAFTTDALKERANLHGVYYPEALTHWLKEQGCYRSKNYWRKR